MQKRIVSAKTILGNTVFVSSFIILLMKPRNYLGHSIYSQPQPQLGVKHWRQVEAVDIALVYYYCIWYLFYGTEVMYLGPKQ